MASHLLAALAIFAVPLAHGQAAPPGDGGPASPQDQGQAPVVVTGKKDPRAKIVCETRIETGSVVPKRRCTTLAEREARATRDRAAAEQLRDSLDRQRQARRLVCLKSGKC